MRYSADRLRCLGNAVVPQQAEFALRVLLDRQGVALPQQELQPPTPAWIRCPDCENYLCTIHQEHAHDCPCPPVEEWETDPYSSSV